MEHKITTEKIKEAASKCSTAKDTLKVLFPEAFEVRPEYAMPFFEKGRNTSNIQGVFKQALEDLGLEVGSMAVAWGFARNDEEKGRAILLNSRYDWRLVKIGTNSLLIPYIAGTGPKE